MKPWQRAVATVIGLVAVLVLVLAVFGLPIDRSLVLIYQGAFQNKFAWSETLVKMTPLLLVGTGIIVAWRAGMYNIGGEGQFLVGGLMGATVAKLAIGAGGPLHPALVSILIILGSIVGGALYGGIAGWLHVKRGVQVVISTILLNFIALQMMDWAASGPLQEAKGQLPLTDLLPDEVMLPRFDRQTDFHIGFFIALAVVVAVYVFLFLSKGGFRLRVVGDNPRAARANRISPDATQLKAMLLSGALCGLAGGIEYVGVAGQLGRGFSQSWGFIAIPVALVGGLHPLLLIPSALFFAALFAGSENLGAFTTAGTTLNYVIQGAAVLALVAMRALLERKPLKMEAE